ncbi:methyltransferase domain-containing protein [Zymoseptoria brevis]|uniref:Methyltransferase domain-containing protein n=1 Tax=Zymoseptoria brevis TaxID=1047168 RepID=A0A0F4GMF2_9PEZI|nr:methyltransferase domain-containing protein [Zymoseptoria brevis]
MASATIATAEPHSSTDTPKIEDTAAKKGSVYSLGYTSAERQRLIDQHGALTTLFGEPPLCPLEPSKIRKIVDVGCGVNASNSLLFAQKFPHAQVYGIDLSPVSIDNKPSNLTFIEGNVLHLLGKDDRLAPGTVDLVYSRLLVAGMTDWRGYMTSVSHLLAPGGWLELHDIAGWTYHLGDDPRPLTDDWEWYAYVLKQMKRPMQLDLGTFNHADEIMRDELGLVGCEKKTLRIPRGLDEDVEVGKREAARTIRNGWRDVLIRMVETATKGLEEEKAREVMEQVEETLEPREGMWSPFVVAWGRRAE